MAAFLIAFLAFGSVSGSALAAPTADLVFSSGGQIFLIHSDGTGRRAVTDPVIPSTDYYDEMGDSSPRISPDGKRIVFQRNIENANFETTNSIITADIEGGDERVLITDPDEDSGDPMSFGPVYSPDGTRIYFGRYTERGRRLTSEIRSMAPDGTGERLITRSTLTFTRNKFKGEFFLPFDVAPSPVNDELLVTYYPVIGSKPSRSYLVDSKTGTRRLLERDASSGAWSPDGTKIVFNSERSRIGKSCYEGRCSFDSHLFVMNSDGTGVRKLFRGKPAGYQGMASWSADGKRIAFVGDRANKGLAGSSEIYSVAPDGTCLTRLTNGSPDSYLPAWSPEPGRSSEPAACGDAAPDPIVDIPISKHITDLKLTPLWAGESVGNELLSDVFKDGRGVSFTYWHCSALHAADCLPPIEIESGPTCEDKSDSVLYSGSFVGLTRFRGGLLMRSKATERYGFETSFFSGGVETTIRTQPTFRGRKVSRSVHRQVLNQLRPVTSTDETVPRFEPAVFARRQVERAKETLRKSKSQRITGKANRAYLRFGRAIERLGGVKVTKCKRFNNVGTPSVEPSDGGF